MNSSTSIDMIAPALVAIQGEIKTIGFDASNPEYRSAYATIDKIMDEVRPILFRNKCALTQGANIIGEKELLVTSRLVHWSGQWIENTVVMPLVGRMLKGGARAEPDPQSGGSALSYGRRYGVCALLALVTGEDDDGNAASKQPAKRAQKAVQAPAQSIPESEPDRPAQRWTGSPGDRPLPFGDTKGQPLSSHSTEHLKKILKWCQGKNDPAKFGDLIKDIGAVLTERSLGTDADTTMRRVNDAVQKEDDQLPF